MIPLKTYISDKNTGIENKANVILNNPMNSPISEIFHSHFCASLWNTLKPAEVSKVSKHIARLRYKTFRH